MHSLTAEVSSDLLYGSEDFERLQRSFRGEIVLPSSMAYDTARLVWNGVVDRRPAVIAYCTEPQDVIAAIAFVRATRLPLAVRSGGHNVAGASVCDGGLVIDLSRMKGIEVDVERRVVRAEAGLSLAEFDTATQAHGLATTMGVNGDTGIAGLTLGGGFGKLGRRYGLACDNLLAAEVVTADGRLMRASETENADLFWGLRGGGGNFGVVTAFEYRLHPVGPNVLAGSVVFDEADAHDAMRFYHEFSRNAPDELSLDAAMATAAPGKRVFSISACYSGPFVEGERVLAPLRAYGKPLDNRIDVVPYLQIQSAGDSIFPRGRRYYWKAQFLREISDAAIDALIGAYATAPSPSALAVFQQVGGAIARVPAAATAYGGRDAAYDCFPIAIWDDPADDEANLAWGRAFWAAMRPFSTGVAYVNNLGDEGEDRIQAAYGANYPRLVALKNKYDPTNLFRMNQNIRPNL
ncbi:FAD/FMN-containing dehydrogenase [Mesorhizobium soli]|uniref:FAD-binding oxidoreductase n=1 Tax=Pseudaminobacter soli (ex Li et al. 2025) TaxID=1295366 RepID=UPI00247411A3|nr:FAD-binding oxidoreductase [Mesorhizobium soli]MDH6234042.1 FAD/FMN-containing dehydrogenase [Mesorhizobium soli]